MRRVVPAIQPVQANARGSDNTPMPSNIAVVLNNYLRCKQRVNTTENMHTDWPKVL